MNTKIKETFYLVIDGKGNENDLKELFNYCVNISEIYLWSSSRVSEGNLNKWNVTIKELAFDSIVSLFTKNSRGNLAIIQSYLNWESEIADESDLDFFLHRVVWRSSEQRLVNLMKETDPVFTKILKTISTGISQNGYKKLSYFGVVYVVADEHSEIAAPVISSDEFWKIPQSYFLKKQKKLLEGLLQYLKRETEYFPALPLNDMIKRIKDLHLNNNIRNLRSDDFEIIELNDLVNHAKEHIINKINSSYLSKGKLNKKDIDKIIAVFDNIAEDLMDGGINSGMMVYFEKHFPGEPKDKYYDKYQAILNYLHKIFKSEISSKLF